MHALSAHEAGRPSNSRGPVPSEKSVDGSKGNRSCWQRGQGVGEPYSSIEADLIRYADDFVMCFERRDDAERVLAVLDKRMAKFDLKLHPQKTRLVNMERPAHAQQSGKGHDTFDFLEFTTHWRRSIKGHWVVGFKDKSERLQKAMNAVTEYCRSQRTKSVQKQHAGLVWRLRGWYNYFGINGNTCSLGTVLHHTQTVWRKWLNRRSQRGRINWKRFRDLLKTYPLPPVRVYTRIW